MLAQFDALLDGLAAVNLTGYSDDELLDFMTGVEERVRRLATVDHALLAETDSRALAFRHGCSSTAALLTQLLHLGVWSARARVRAAQRLAPRRALTGEVLPAEFPATAAAQAAGSISPEHARIIANTIAALPAGVRDEKFDQIEPELTDYARPRSSSR